VHLVTNTLPTDDARACHPSMDAPPPKLMPAIAPAPYPTLTYQLAATRLREMGVDVPGDGWITDVFLEDVVKVMDGRHTQAIRELDAELRHANNEAKGLEHRLGTAYELAEIAVTNLKNLRAKIEDGEHYGEGFDLMAELTGLIGAAKAMRDGMDR